MIFLKYLNVFIQVFRSSEVFTFSFGTKIYKSLEGIFWAWKCKIDYVTVV